MSTLERWQWSLNGLLMGRGSRYRFATAPTGLGTPPARVSDLSWLTDDGVAAAGDYLEAREVTASFVLLGDTPADAETLARTLAGAWAPLRSDTTLFLQHEDGRSYTLTGRPRRCEVFLDGLKSGIARAAVAFLATDPYLYDEVQQSAVLTLGTGVVPGITPPIVFPMDFEPAGASPGIASLPNDGTARSLPTVTITGPVVTPRLENLTTGETMTFNVTLIAGDTLVVDCAARTITRNGTPNLGLLALGSPWLNLQPGANTIAYRSADAIPPASTATLAWRSAWY